MVTLDREIVASTRERGIGILPGLLRDRELEEARAAFDQAFRDAGKGAPPPGTRDGLAGETLLQYPALVRLFAHPRILGIVAGVMEDPRPWIWHVNLTRYVPPYAGMAAHTDGWMGELSPPFARQAMAVFLDDISAESGALTYVPGTHRLHYEAPGEPGRQPPTADEIAAGDYLPAVLTAGSVLFRVPEVWHAVNPIHHLRRYVTASFMGRGRLSPKAEKARAETMTRRRALDESAIPAALREYCW